MKTVASQKVQSSSGSASKYRESYISQELVVPDGEISFEELEGKIVQYVDRDFKIRTERVFTVDRMFLRTKDAVGKKHRVSKTQIIFAYSRRNGNAKVVV